MKNIVYLKVSHTHTHTRTHAHTHARTHARAHTHTHTSTHTHTHSHTHTHTHTHTYLAYQDLYFGFLVSMNFRFRAKSDAGRLCVADAITGWKLVERNG